MQIIDGGMMAFAAFHALKDKVKYPLTHQMPLMLLKLVSEAADTFAVCWDGEHLWKRDYLKGYRSRPEIWEAAGRHDFDNMFTVLSALGVLQFRRETLEADEQLASLVHALDGQEPLLIRSDDKDFMQLLSPTTWMHGRVRGVVKPLHVENILNVPVKHVVDLLAITGDKVDGIASIASTAQALRIIRKHGHVTDFVDADTDDPELERLLDRARDQLLRNYKLVDLSENAVGTALKPSVQGFGDVSRARDAGKKLGIAHLQDDATFLPLLTWGMRTVEKLLAMGHLQ